MVQILTIFVVPQNDLDDDVLWEVRTIRTLAPSWHPFFVHMMLDDLNSPVLPRWDQ